MGYKIVFDEDKCVGCGQCVDICPVQVWELQDGKSAPVNEEASAANPAPACANRKPS